MLEVAWLGFDNREKGKEVRATRKRKRAGTGTERQGKRGEPESCTAGSVSKQQLQGRTAILWGERRGPSSTKKPQKPKPTNSNTLENNQRAYCKNRDLENEIVRNVRTVLGVLFRSVQRFWKRHDTIKKQLPCHVSSPELSPEGDRGKPPQQNPWLQESWAKGKEIVL